MEQYVGLDVSLKETHYSVVDAGGVELARGREVTRPDPLAVANFLGVARVREGREG